MNSSSRARSPVYEAAVKDGTISSYGWLAHQTGGKWRRADYFTAGSVQGCWMHRRRWADQDDAKAKKLVAGVRVDLQLA